MPTNIKAGLSIVALVVAVFMYFWEANQGILQLSWFVIGLSLFMVLAMWIFPEIGPTREDQKGPDRLSDGAFAGRIV